MAVVPARAQVMPSPSAASPARASGQLPTLGDGNELTPAAERQLGERIARELYRDPDYIDDPVVSDYVQSLWQPLLQAARQRGDMGPEMDGRYAWKVLLGRDRTVNAFALPGGWLGLHLGLVAVTATRDELASVLAHELSHVTQRHIARMASADQRQMPWLLGALLIGVMAAARNPDAGSALVVGGQALAVQNQLNFSREMEREADRIGYGVLTQAGFDAQGFASMFEKLQQASRLNDNGSFPYLRTHPLTVERIADMRARQTLQAVAPARPDLEHVMVAARARALSAADVESQRSLLRAAQNQGMAPTAARAESASATQATPALGQAAALYAGVMAALRLREASQADGLLERLSALVAPDARAARQVRLLEAEVALSRGDAARAAAAVGDAPQRPELLLAAQAAVRSGQPALLAHAAQRLQAWVAVTPSDATAWQLLASAYAAQGQALRAIRAEAEARVALLDYPAALDRLRAGQELARQGGGDHIEASIIDARARQIQAQLREQALERRVNQ